MRRSGSSLHAGEPGSELLAPLAIVVLGGLITSTFLNLIVVPAGYALVFGARDANSSSATGLFGRLRAALPESRTPTTTQGD